jgi:hypothetical protein
MRFLIGLIFALCPVVAFAQADKPPPIDFTVAIVGPDGKPDLAEKVIPCPTDKSYCWKEWTLGYTAYAALCAAQKDPRNPSALDPDEAKRCALGWRIYAATTPLDLTTDQRSMLKAALFRGLAIPVLAYGACRMIVPPEECEK